jgi:hypothetical protein
MRDKVWLAQFLGLDPASVYKTLDELGRMRIVSVRVDPDWVEVRLHVDAEGWQASPLVSAGEQARARAEAGRFDAGVRGQGLVVEPEPDLMGKIVEGQFAAICHRGEMGSGGHRSEDVEAKPQVPGAGQGRVLPAHVAEGLRALRRAVDGAASSASAHDESSGGGVVSGKRDGVGMTNRHVTDVSSGVPSIALKAVQSLEGIDKSFEAVSFERGVQGGTLVQRLERAVSSGRGGARDWEVWGGAWVAMAKDAPEIAETALRKLHAERARGAVSNVGGLMWCAARDAGWVPRKDREGANRG